MLLLAYTFSFAHNVIPHCHHAFGSSSAESHKHVITHEHHEKENQHHDDDDQSHHQGHSQKCLNITDDLFCFLSCLLSEAEHPSSDADQHFLLTEIDGNKLNDRLKNQLASVLTILLFDFYEDNIKVTPQPEVQDFYTPPLLAYSPLRGPPSISC